MSAGSGPSSSSDRLVLVVSLTALVSCRAGNPEFIQDETGVLSDSSRSEGATPGGPGEAQGLSGSGSGAGTAGHEDSSTSPADGTQAGTFEADDTSAQDHESGAQITGSVGGLDSAGHTDDDPHETESSATSGSDSNETGSTSDSEQGQTEADESTTGTTGADDSSSASEVGDENIDPGDSSDGDARWSELDCLSRVVVRFDTRLLSIDVDHQPVPVRLDGALIDFAQVLGFGEGIRFVLADSGQLLDHEIERWDASGTSLFWVSIPMLYAGRVDQEIWMYYDCSEAARVDARAVWSTRYDGVWHLEGDVVDSGPNAFPGHDVGSTKAAGVLAGGRHYDGRGGYTQLGENGALHDVSSVSLWVAFESFSDTLGDNVLLSIAGEDEVLAENYQLKFSVDADRRLYAFWEYANAKNVEDNFSSKAADIVSMVWYHLAVVRDVDAKTLEYYVNGERLGEIMGFEFGPEGGSSATIWLGAGQAGLVRNLHGFLDEVRVSRGLMTAPMIRADYLSSVGSIVSLGVPESRSMP